MDAVLQQALVAKLAAVRWIQTHQAHLSVGELSRAVGVIRSLSNAARMAEALQKQRGGRL